MIKYFDIHGHVNFEDYGADQADVIKRATDAGVGMITVAVDPESSRTGLELAAAYENMWTTVGTHPTDVIVQKGDLAPLAALAANPKCVAIGECGLDYFHSEPKDREYQRELFIEQIQLANSVGKPLMLHVRNGKGAAESNAYQDALHILKELNSKVRANFHFFAGTLQDLKDILDHNYTVSFTGVITFTKDYDELIRYAPITHIMSETDCPFVAPVPYRGKRNEPAYVVEVVKALARIRGEDEEEVRQKLLENVKDFFKITF